MAKNKTQIQRLIYVDKMIREGMKSGELANCTTIAAAYEVSYKSIMRDIDYLKNQCDAPIEYNPRQHGFFYTEENYKLPAINISESDLFAIYIARKAIEQHKNTPVYQKLVSVFSKIEDSLPDRISLSPVWVENRFSVFNDFQTRISPGIWEAVAEALHHCWRLRISYLKPGDKDVVSREVDPYHVVSYHGEWYLIGYCYLRQGIRVFAISRVKQIKKMDDFFSIPDDFNHEEFADSHFGIFRDDRRHDVQLKFSAKHAPYILEREWHPSQTVRELEGGSLLLFFSTSHLFEVKRWILSWGSGVEVLAPSVLRADINSEIEKILQAYN